MPELTLPALAPESLVQTINPWNWVANLTAFRIGELNVYMGDSTRPEVEKEILRSVGSYGRQIGQLSDALAVLLRHVDLSKLSPEDTEVIRTFEGQVAKVNQVKRRTLEASSAE